MLKAIVNVNQEWGIGKDGDLLVYIPEDMKFFRQQTKGKTLVMGRKTLESFPEGRPLKGRRSILLTRDPSGLPEAARTYLEGRGEAGTSLEAVGSLEELLALLGTLKEEEVYVIGGEQLYRALLPYCGECQVTVNDCKEKADTWFPDLDSLPGWRRREAGAWQESEGIRYRFTTYENLEPRELP